MFDGPTVGGPTDCLAMEGGPANCPAIGKGPTVRGGCTTVAGGPVDYAVDGLAELLPDGPADCAADDPT